MEKHISDGTAYVVFKTLKAARPDSLKASIIAERTGLPVAVVVAAVKELLWRDLVEVVPSRGIEIHVAVKEGEAA